MGYDNNRHHRSPDTHSRQSRTNKHYRDEIYSLRVPAGKRTYFFDVKSTRSGDDFFVTITESKRVDDGQYEKFKLFLYKEDFAKFIRAMHDVVAHIRDECLPDYEFEDLPELTGIEEELSQTSDYNDRDY